MIYTVKGPIPKNKIGLTLSHEHFKWECDEYYALGIYFDNDYDELKIEEAYNNLLPIVKKLKESGCSTIVETSPPIGGQNLKLLKRLSDSCDINIIPCTGLSICKYAANLFPENFAQNLSKRMIRDFTHGLLEIDGVTIKPGYIKILLENGDLNFVDTEMIRAAVRASNSTGLPVHCHIIESKKVFQVIDIIKEENMDLSKFLWAHGDHEKNIDTIEKAINLGIWVGIDNIQAGTHKEEFTLLKTLMDKNLHSKILLSQDYDFYELLSEKNPLRTVSSLLNEFIPYCVSNGIDRSLLNTILSKNPAEFYNIEE